MPKNAKTSSTATALNRAQPSEAHRRDRAVEQILDARDHAPGLTPGDSTARPRQTKAALVRQMLLDPQGATLPALIAATGWQAHTVRAVLSGLRKSGLTITRQSREVGPLYLAVSTPDAPRLAGSATTHESREDASGTAHRHARRRTTRRRGGDADKETAIVGADAGRSATEAAPSVQA